MKKWNEIKSTNITWGSYVKLALIATSISMALYAAGMTVVFYGTNIASWFTKTKTKIKGYFGIKK